MKTFFVALAEKAKLPQHLVITTMKKTAEATRQYWLQNKQALDLNPKIILTIDAHMKSIPL